jgi:hypothetical protein
MVYHTESLNKVLNAPATTMATPAPVTMLETLMAEIDRGLSWVSTDFSNMVEHLAKSGLLKPDDTVKSEGSKDANPYQSLSALESWLLSVKDRIDQVDVALINLNARII